MFGAIAGDVIGSVYEFNPIKTTDFTLFKAESCFTDDTVLTIAAADAVLKNADYAERFRAFGQRYPGAGYGGKFYQWLFDSEGTPYNSWGNGSAMRVSPVGFAFNDSDIVLEEAGKSAAVTHNHPEGIKGAQAVALAIYLARTGKNKEYISGEISHRFDYNLKRTIDEIRPGYSFDVSCQGSVPEAIIAFLDSVNYEDAVRKAISLGGDSDTIACITGGIAQAFYKDIPRNIVIQVQNRLPEEFLDIIDTFNQQYNIQLMIGC